MVLERADTTEQVVYFFRQVVGVAAVDKEVLSRDRESIRLGRGLCPQSWHAIEWAEKGVRKED